ncbi:hypothetical protein OQ257_08630 [Actinobacillus equuli subsp. equuli]|uniref:Uncharacterized protein n=1 Tax=Actinobacillus equuli subsp. equuli TaxID=202947 RepID=A0A9X4G4J9_ACTEU|nr:hypothetical protein [Actinobacillus equuli]MDE8035228.1 hypothetical protein [Actinobacillus equuli subsp. equuli]
MEKNFGYRLGTLVRRFKEWNHPTLLKWCYVISVTLSLLILFFDIFVWLLVCILCLIAIVLYSDVVWGITPAEKRITDKLEQINQTLKGQSK